MTNRNLPLPADGGVDDLPRTLRRERDARAAAQRDRDQGFTPEPAYARADPLDQFRDEPQAAVVTQIKIPFFRLVVFFIKAVFAAIPALIILGALLWGSGKVLKTFFPQLVQMQIEIKFPNK
jgi:hypothetical protein